MKWNADKYDSGCCPQAQASRELLKCAGVRVADSVLDLGCGTGAVTVELARIAREGRVTGIDPSGEMLAKARRNADDFDNVAIQRGNALNMDFQDEFDVVVSNSALHWIKDQEPALKNVHAALKPGGRAALQFLHRDSFIELFAAAAAAAARLSIAADFSQCDAEWFLADAADYRALLEKTGFTDIGVMEQEFKYMSFQDGLIAEYYAGALLRPYMEHIPRKHRAAFVSAFVDCIGGTPSEGIVEFALKRVYAYARREITY
jgi:trans-aconitate methyltransferase